MGRALSLAPGDGLQTALLPLLALMVVGCVQIARHARIARRVAYAPPSATIATPAARIATPTT